MRSLSAIVALALLAGSAHAQVIGQNFTASSRAQTGFIPPDTMASIGPTHVVELINGRYALYSKTGSNNPDGTRSPILATSLNNFWSGAGVTPQGQFAFDPRVVYDPFSQRFFAAAVDNRGLANNFLLAVSNTSNPQNGWKGVRIDSDPTNLRSADFPTLGVNADGVYLAANMFAVPGQALGQQTTLVAVPKSDLLQTTPTAANARLFENVAVTTGFSAQPVVNLDNTGSPQPFLAFAGQLRRTDLVGPIATATLVGTTTTISSFGNPPEAPQKQNFSTGQQTPKADINTLDNRLGANVVLQEGVLWGIQTCSVSGRAALRWFKMLASNNELLESGVISDPDLYFYYGSIAVNEFGDVVIGASGSSVNQFVSSYAFVGDSAGDSVLGTTTFGAPMLLKAGVDDYEVLDGVGRNRWGDYTATMLDPGDPFSFWTIQEFVSADNQYSLQVTQILVPEPGALALASFTLILIRRSRRC
jgi:hypothetical protein